MVGSQRQLLEDQNSEAAIHGLPNELSVEIFNYTLPYRSERGLQALGASNLLASVCLRWRSVALSTTSLWSMISFDEAVGSQDLAMERTTALLQRSKSHPIDVVFQLQLNGSGLRGVPSEVWKAIVPHIPRCRSLTIQLPSIRDFLSIFPLPGNLPFLSTFRCNVGWSQFRDLPPYLLFDSATYSTPNLSELSVSCDFRMLSSLDTNTLLTLDLGAREGVWPELSMALLPAKNLTRLRLEMMVEDEREAPNPLKLPHLKYLFYRGGRPSNLLQAPQLRKLTFEFQDVLRNISDIQINFPSLTDLTILDPYLENMAFFFEWLRSQPSIMRLAVHDPSTSTVPSLVDYLVGERPPFPGNSQSALLPTEMHQGSSQQPPLLPSLCLFDITRSSDPYWRNIVDWEQLHRMRPALRVRHYEVILDGPLVDLTLLEKVSAESLEWGWYLFHDTRQTEGEAHGVWPVPELNKTSPSSLFAQYLVVKTISPNAPKSRITTQLQRSKTHLIDVTFRVYSYGSGFTAAQRTVWKAIVPHLPRCRSLELHLSSFNNFSEVFPLSGNLQKLSSLRCYDDRSYPLFEDGFNFLPLEDLSLSSNFPILSRMETSNLFSLDLDGQMEEWREMRPFLASAEALIRLRLSIYVDAMEADSDHIDFPNLQYLFYPGIHPSNIFRAPQLRKLVLGCHTITRDDTAINATFPSLSDVTLKQPFLVNMGLICMWLDAQLGVSRLGVDEPEDGVAGYIVQHLSGNRKKLGKKLTTPVPPPPSQPSHSLPSLRLLVFTNSWGNPNRVKYDRKVKWEELNQGRPNLRVCHYSKTFDGPLVDLEAVERLAWQSLTWGWERSSPLPPRLAFGVD
ncbi:hypothetical protein DL93DRAFT_2093151 [Clavulina sp. PMI_390]|nr:hypothetical protein DL93DRAFT_2093151 [Clavulina sp. PMI_390]